MVKFRTKFERVRVRSNPGSRFVNTYKPVYTESGALELEKSGVIDVYEQIQSFKDSTNIQSIIKRFNNGDVNALNQKLPYFADVTELPTNLAGFLQLYQEAQNTFSGLSSDIRAQFNNSASEFFAQAGTDRFNRIMGVGVRNDNTIETIKESEFVESKSE